MDKNQPCVDQASDHVLLVQVYYLNKHKISQRGTLEDIVHFPQSELSQSEACATGILYSHGLRKRRMDI